MPQIARLLYRDMTALDGVGTYAVTQRRATALTVRDGGQVEVVR